MGDYRIGGLALWSISHVEILPRVDHGAIYEIHHTIKSAVYLINNRALRVELSNTGAEGMTGWPVLECWVQWLHR